MSGWAGGPPSRWAGAAGLAPSLIAAARARQPKEHDGARAYQPRLRKSPPGTWTDERLLAALRDWFVTSGETPLSYEWSPRSAELLGLPMAGARRRMREDPRRPRTATGR